MLSDDEINAIWSAKDTPLHRTKLSDFGLSRIRAILAAHTAKLLAVVEMDWDSLTDNPNQSDIKEWVQQYAAAAAAKAREACAQICEKYAKANEESDTMVEAFLHCADAIRKLEI